LALTGVKEEAKVGARTVIEVLNAEQEVFTAKVNAVIARHDELVASYQIRAAMGSMVAKDLKLQVDLYDPDVHYNEANWSWIGLGH
jgi:outer membrane protein